MPYRLMKYRWLPSWVRRTAVHIGRRGIILFFFGFLYVSAGIGWIIYPPMSPNFDPIFRIADPKFWGVAQMVVGLIMILGGLWKKVEHAAFGVSAFLPCLFGLGILTLYLPGGDSPDAAAPRALITYLLYSVFILIVSGWPEERQPPKEKTKDDHGN